jgi:hypothetical protein
LGVEVVPATERRQPDTQLGKLAVPEDRPGREVDDDPLTTNVGDEHVVPPRAEPKMARHARGTACIAASERRG